MIRFARKILFQCNQLVDGICGDWVARWWFLIGLIVGIGLSWVAWWCFSLAAFFLIVIIGIWVKIKSI